jgi:beta-galactosidase/beta-glucuronidase
MHPTVDYPRPAFVRDRWSNLNGRWDFARSSESDPAKVNFDAAIIVPFPPEAPLSGLHDESYHERVWYRRTFTVPEGWRGARLIVHFGAVDSVARVWVNGRMVAQHEGGHTPFSADVTDSLTPEGPQTIIVCADDDPHDMQLPRGKQDWLPEPHGIWYPRTTGIWQSVWLEPVAAEHVARVRFTPDLASFSVALDVTLSRYVRGTLHVTLRHGDRILIDDRFAVDGKRVARTLALPDPGIDDARRALLWSPEHPTLLPVDLRLEVDGVVTDHVASYAALRSVEAREGLFHLNGRPYPLRLVLDQGYWQDGLMTAPDGKALRRDVVLTKALGFNGVRKHQKIEDPRFLHLADTLGLLVWEELPSAYAFGADAVARLTRVWLEVIERDYNHPCIVTWVAFNESWGVPDLPNDPRQRHAVSALYHLAKSLDATRLVVGNDGWEHVVTDLITLHDYSRDPRTLSERYGSDAAARASARSVLEHGRVGMLRADCDTGQPVLLSEFGGIRYHPEGVGWGYQQVEDPADLLRIYAAMIAALPIRGVAGFCYTQLTDTFQEQNGLLFADRSPKAPLEAFGHATREGRVID